MLFHIFESFINIRQYIAIASITAFAVCFLLLKLKLPFLPKDKGRAFAVNGEVSKGKIRGVGLIMISTFVLCSVFLLPVTKEFICYDVLLFLEMLSGYLDDASDKPWSDYKKGFIDLIICIIISVVFVYNNSTTIMIFDYEIYIHPVLFAALSTILLWIGINVTNCSDGVDGLCATLSIISLLSISLIFFNQIGEQYTAYSFIMVGVLIAYLCFNTGPSSQLMGDAGSRPLGLLIVLMVLKSSHPMSYLLLSAVLLVDGIVGLIKIFLKRFLKIDVLKNIRTPIHDEMRKNQGWSDTQVVVRFSIIQVLLSVIQFIICK
ncbi:MAG: phospho-N-acetylmuramoyl-pentapeptide-transferase [Eubacterium sp.]